MLPLKVQNLHKTYSNGTAALKGVSFAIEPGEGVVLLGANGSGKSTLLRCIVGLERFTQGEIWVGDVAIAQAKRPTLRQISRRVGMVFQQFDLVNSLTAFHNVLHGALGRSHGPHYWFPATAPTVERQRAMQCLERVGLAHLAQQRVDTLSGGQRQRVAIARMLMQDPELLLVDEPVASLDPKAGREVMDLLWEIVRERQLSVICTLHQLELAVDYADRIIGLRQGQVKLDVTADYLHHQDLTLLYDAKGTLPVPQPGLLNS